MDELYKLIDYLREKEYRDRKFFAALQGIDLDEGKSETDFEKIKLKAQAELSGKSEEEVVFNMVGIEFDNDDE